MAVSHGRVAGVPAMLFRVSFTGELGYEINVPAGARPHRVGGRLRDGRRSGLTPYGTETMHVLRAEKGYIIVGQDTDGTATPDDAGLAWAIGRKKPDFVGKRSIERGGDARPGPQAARGAAHPRAAASCSRKARSSWTGPGLTPPMKPVGHVTSSYASEALGHSIALAMVAGGRARIGQTLYLPMPGGEIEVEVTKPRVLRPGRGAAAWLKTARRYGCFRLRRASSCSAERTRATGPALLSGLRCPRWPAAPSRQRARRRCGSGRTSGCCSLRTARGNPSPPRSKRRSPDIPHSLVDVSHRQVALRIAGPRASELLASGCPLDLDPDAFPVGMCTRTVLARAEVVLWRLSAEEYHLETGRSFSGYVLEWLREAERGG